MYEISAGERGSGANGLFAMPKSLHEKLLDAIGTTLQ